MPIKTILVPVDGSDANQAVLAAALAVARRLDAHIEAFHVRTSASDAVSFGMRYIPSNLQDMVVKEAEADALERASSVREKFASFCKEHELPVVHSPREGGASGAWREQTGRISEALVQRARLFDLVMAARPAKAESTIRRSPVGENLEALLLESGRPIMMVPPGTQATVCRNVAIAWNASAESARAVASAMWCLSDAASITVLASKRRAEHAKELVENLAWHAIPAAVREFETGSRSVGETLLAEASEVEADLIVAGGYSQARARQLFFGGVTQHFLRHAHIPILFAH